MIKHGKIAHLFKINKSWTALRHGCTYSKTALLSLIKDYKQTSGNKPGTKTEKRSIWIYIVHEGDHAV